MPLVTSLASFDAHPFDPVVDTATEPAVELALTPLPTLVSAPNDDTVDVLLRQLAADQPELRRRAARALARHPDAAPALAAGLDREPAVSVREAMAASLVAIGGPPVAEVLAPLLRHADAALRAVAVDGLKRLGLAAVPVVDDLLDDGDPDVRLLAAEILRAWPALQAEPRLERLLTGDPQLNVCAAAVEVAVEVGTKALLPALAGVAGRFGNDPFLVFAVATAIGRINTSGGWVR